MPTFDLTTTFLMIGGVIAVVLGLCAYLVLAERKVAAWVQDRLGPNRVGPWGLLQPLADGGKMFLKEDVIPSHVDRYFFLMAPVAAFATAMLAIAVIPFGSTAATKVIPPTTPTQAGTTTFQPVQFYEINYGSTPSQTYAIAPGLDVGLLYVFALGSLAVYGVILAGWSANSKYALLGSLRSSAQIISYEIPLGLSILGVVILASSLNLEAIVNYQAGAGHSWMIFTQPLAFLLFLIAVFAECNRLPFDLPEAEQELVGGFHTEYSSLKLGMLLLAEYAHMITASLLLSVLFLGGWHLPGLSELTDEAMYGPTITALIRMAILGVKMLGFVALFLLVRWTIPRFRFDQLMGLAWKIMIPLAILNLFCVMIVKQYNLPLWTLTVASIVMFLGTGLISAWMSSSVTNPRRKVAPLPPGLPPGVTFAGR